MSINLDSSMSDSDNEVESNNGKSQFECRACLKFVSRGFYDIFQPWNAPWIGMQSTVADDLATIANIEVSNSDPHSKVMCDKCCIKLHNACRFVSTVKKTNDILRLRCSYEVPIEPADKPWPKPIQLEKSMNRSVFTTMDIEVKQEVLSDDDMIGLDEGSRLDSSEIKVEPEEMVDPPPIKVTVNGTISLDDMGSHNLVIANGCAVYEDVDYLDATVKEEPMSEDDQAPLDLSPECMLCSKTFHSISGLKAHVISQHSYKGVERRDDASTKRNHIRYTCGTCGRSFVTSTDLMVHETCHNKSVCYSCSDNFDTFEQLIRHRKCCKALAKKDVAKPKMLEDVIRQFPANVKIRPVKESTLKKDIKKCSICLEEFSDTYYMKIHHEIHHTNSTEETPSNENIRSNELGKDKQTKESVIDNKIETENLQRMFEQTELGNIKVILFRKDKRDSDSSENNIEITSKSDQKQIEDDDCTNKEKSKLEDNKDNEYKKQDFSTKYKKEHIEDTPPVKCEQKENNKLMEQNSVQKENSQPIDQKYCIKNNIKHTEDGNQAEKNIKDEIYDNNSVEHVIEIKKESAQEESDRNKEQMSPNIHIEIQEREHAEESEKCVYIVNKHFEENEQDKFLVAKSEKSEESQHTNKGNIVQDVLRECSEQAKESHKIVIINEQFKKSEPEEKNVTAEIGKSEKNPDTKNNTDKNVLREINAQVEETQKNANIIQQFEMEEKNVVVNSEKSEESQHTNKEKIERNVHTEIQESVQREESEKSVNIKNKQLEESEQANNINESEKSERSQLEQTLIQVSHDTKDIATIESVSEKVKC